MHQAEVVREEADRNGRASASFATTLDMTVIEIRHLPNSQIDRTSRSNWIKQERETGKACSGPYLEAPAPFRLQQIIRQWIGWEFEQLL